MAGLLRTIRSLNALGGYSIAEPYAGGAGASLSLLFHEDVPEVYINDADDAVFAFWWTLANRPAPFLKMLESVPVTIDEWTRQRGIYRSPSRTSRLGLGFAAFFLNRCNRSGIIVDGGPIGGYAQAGKWKLDARFNRAELLRRCERVAKYRDRISVSMLDGLEFVREHKSTETFFFIDPPYVRSERALYLDDLDLECHKALADELRSSSTSAWVVTYNDCPEVREMYHGWAAVRPYRLRYSASLQTGSGGELIITPKWLKLPDEQPSSAIVW